MRFRWPPKATRPLTHTVFRTLQTKFLKEFGKARASLSCAARNLGAKGEVTDGAELDPIRGHRPSAAAVICAFDLIELDGEGLRREPMIETRKSTLKSRCCAAIAGAAQESSGWHPRALAAPEFDQERFRSSRQFGESSHQ